MNQRDQFGSICHKYVSQQGSHQSCQFCLFQDEAGLDASGSSEEEDMDDDQMFQMDDKIAAALKVMARGGANARES